MRSLSCLAGVLVSTLNVAGAQLPARGQYIAHALSFPGYQWTRRTTPHADIYLLRGSDAEPLVASIESDVERAIAADLAWLGERFTGQRLTIFIVGTREQIKPLIGKTYGGLPIFDEHAVFLVGTKSLRPALRHEIMHLFSWQFWGTPATEWLSEGIAMLAAPRCGGVTRVHEMAARLDREGKFIPLETLWHRFNASDEPGVMNYVEGASLFRVHRPAVGTREASRLLAGGSIQGDRTTPRRQRRPVGA